MIVLRGLAVAALGLLVLAGNSAPAHPTTPNVVLVLTDDQRSGLLWAMPTVRSQLARNGVRFTSAFVSNPLCCPSRATILSGAYSHTNGVWANGGAHGGFQVFDDDSTLATWLHDAGYRTGYAGKYLNGYMAPYVPPGWDSWFAFSGTPPYYYEYTAVQDGTLRSYGSLPADYSTDVLASQAVGFINETDSSEPFFFVFAPYAPHKPATPAARHDDAYASWSPTWPPSFNEADVSDKPAYIRHLRPEDPSALEALARNQAESLVAVDEAVADILAALADSGRLSDTLIIFTSDNGQLWGEHRWRTKVVPYEESIDVPLILRYDSLLEPGVDDRLALNVDLAPTIAAAVGIPAPGAEGLDLLSSERRSEFPIEHWRERAPVPSYCGVRTRTAVYVRYDGGFQELYDLDRDPYQLRNRARRTGAHDQLRRMRERARRLCTPLPPGMMW